MFWILACLTIRSVLGTWTNQDISINVNKPIAYIGDKNIIIRCEAQGTQIVKAEWITLLLEGHSYERPMVNMVRTPTGHVFEWGEAFNVTDLHQRMTVNGSLEGTVFLQLDIHQAKFEDGGRYTCNYGGLDKHDRFLEFHESEDFFVQYHIIQSNYTGVLTPNKDILITINKLSAYIGESGVRVRCESPGNVITDPKWISVMVEGLKYQSPLANMFRPINSTKGMFEWSDEFNITDLQNRVMYSGSLTGANPYMELEFKEIKCEDSGRYTCILNGLDSTGNLTQFSSSADFIVKSLNGEPTIKDKHDQVVSNNTVLHKRPGGFIFFNCEGATGKPKIPIIWTESNRTTERVLKERDGAVSGLEIIPDDDLCRFHSQLHLYYIVPDKPVTLKCKIAFSVSIVHIIPTGNNPSVYHNTPHTQVASNSVSVTPTTTVAPQFNNKTTTRSTTAAPLPSTTLMAVPTSTSAPTSTAVLLTLTTGQPTSKSTYTSTQATTAKSTQLTSTTSSPTSKSTLLTSSTGQPTTNLTSTLAPTTQSTMLTSTTGQPTTNSTSTTVPTTQSALLTSSTGQPTTNLTSTLALRTQSTMLTSTTHSTSTTVPTTQSALLTSTTAAPKATITSTLRPLSLAPLTTAAVPTSTTGTNTVVQTNSPFTNLLKTSTTPVLILHKKKYQNDLHERMRDKFLKVKANKI
ncbi:uncharacterized protein LOC134269725 [Saccostrea cucullata]|uniref:uncharacterized protein LOC134269725 n=1 Tax=Saccostrea cuccullata TaxID=36930 RepID=UPI002ED27365